MPHNQLMMEKLKYKAKDKENSARIEDDANTSTVSAETSEAACETNVDTIVDLNSNLVELMPQTADKSEDLTKGEYDEITEACKSLVESTIRLELEEAAAVECGKAPLEDKKSSRDYEHTGRAVVVAAVWKTPKNLPVGVDQEIMDADADAEQEQEQEQDSGHRQHMELIRKLRLQLRDLERYAYERGELGEMPASVIAERQTVILDTLKERLSLSIDMNEIDKLELDELRKQVDKEIHDLIDPLITKDHLLGQLKTQLTDLERYITYLHETIGKIHDKSTCTCQVHGCCTSKMAELSLANDIDDENSQPASNKERNTNESRLIENNTLPKTTKLIRSLVTQLICSDIKLRETAKKAQILEDKSKSETDSQRMKAVTCNKSPKAIDHDDAAWTLHIDKVILATDSLVNLFDTEPEYQRNTDTTAIDDRLVESIVRRQLVPAIRDLLSYGLIDLSSMPKSTSYVSLLFDPYYLLTSLTCFPSSTRGSSPNGGNCSASEKVHLWNVIEEYYESRNGSSFKNSSVKTLSQSFDLAPSISGPIKITSKQALLIAIDDINETLSRSKPNGPESHFRAFIYTGLNRAKLTTWLRILFKNKSMAKKFYHNFSFVGQQEKVDKLLATIEPLAQLDFKLRIDSESIEQFVSAF